MGKNRLIVKQPEEVKKELRNVETEKLENVGLGEDERLNNNIDGIGEINKSEKKENKAEVVKKNGKKSSKIVAQTADTLKGIAEGRKLEMILDKKNLPFLFFITFLGILYISNTYYASNTLRQMERVKSQIRELRYEYVNTEKRVIELSRRNVVMERLKINSKELKESKVPPYQLTVSSEQ